MPSIWYQRRAQGANGWGYSGECPIEEHSHKICNTPQQADGGLQQDWDGLAESLRSPFLKGPWPPGQLLVQPGL